MYTEVLLDALLDTLKALPLLFVVYYLIELLEYKSAIKLEDSKLLTGGTSPIFGSLIGCVPQCGFSVISTDLFSHGSISVGALIAVYIATSDEAIPIMIAHPESIKWMVMLIVVKILLGVVIGYLSLLLYKLLFKNVQHKKHTEAEHNELIEHGGCCHHNVESKSFDWKHPLLHCLKITAFILIINLLFGTVVYFVGGEENLSLFLQKSELLQPVLAVLIGLIPNCASSVVLTELFVVGGLKFSALLAGLSVNAGLGLIVLLKANKNWKENLFIFAMLIVPSLVVGYGLLFI